MSPNAGLIWPEIKAYFTDRGFHRPDDELRFTQKTRNGSNVVVVNFDHDRGLDDLVLSFGVEHTACDEFFSQLFPNQSPTQMPTVLYPSCRFDLSVNPGQVIHQLDKLITVEADLFFEKYGNEHLLEVEINRNPQEAFPFIHRPLRRMVYGLFLAKKFQSTHFQSLANAYEKMLDNPKMKGHFEKMIKDLT